MKTENCKNCIADWAESYFAPDGENVNVLTLKAAAIENMKSETGNSKMTAQAFKREIMAFCKNKGYELNPRELCNRRDSEGKLNRIFKTEINGVQAEYYYIKTN